MEVIFSTFKLNSPEKYLLSKKRPKFYLKSSKVCMICTKLAISIEISSPKISLLKLLTLNKYSFLKNRPISLQISDSAKNVTILQAPYLEQKITCLQKYLGMKLMDLKLICGLSEFYFTSC